MKKIKPDGSKTIYVGGIYEVDKATGGSVTRTVTYYPVAGAMRINNTLYYTLKDHLGSASVVTDASGNVVGEQRYYPYGETRLTTGTIYTDKLFTGQREITGLGIYHFNARFYSPKLGRFLSADTIIPGAANPQAYNRYSYTVNNPLRYTDPTGHMMTEGDAGSSCFFCINPPPDLPSCGGLFQQSCGGNGGGGGGNDGDDPAPVPSPDDIALPSWADIINFLFEPSPDPGVSDLIQMGVDSSPVFPTPLGPVINPLFGSGQAIGDTVDAVGLAIYMVVNYVELPASGSTTPSINFTLNTCSLAEAYCYSGGTTPEWMIPAAPFPP